MTTFTQNLRYVARILPAPPVDPFIALPHE
jgi:hypothetical protein